MPTPKLQKRGPGAIVPDHFPDELQRLIFEVAARADGKTARQLILVAPHVRKWIEPILYECIIVRSQRDAVLLLDTIRSKPQGFLASHARSLGLGESVTFQQSKPILAECRRILHFAVWGIHRNPSIFLPFIRSPAIRTLSLKSQHPSELNIPPSVLSSLTHLIILDGPYTWFHLRQAAHNAKSSDASDAEHSSATEVFRSLTHFGVCSQNWGSAQSILKLAENLKYFAVIIPPRFKATAIVAQRISELGDRRVVLVVHQQTMENWEAATKGQNSGLWDKVEKLVREGYFADHGEPRKWSEVA